MGSTEAAFCWDYCGKCPNYLDDCRGCISTDHSNCYFVKCCLEKGIEHCGFCMDFPCEKLESLFLMTVRNVHEVIILKTCEYEKLLELKSG